MISKILLPENAFKDVTFKELKNGLVHYHNPVHRGGLEKSEENQFMLDLNKMAFLKELMRTWQGPPRRWWKFFLIVEAFPIFHS